MADNINVRDSAGTVVTMRSNDVSGIQVPVHRLDSLTLTGTAGLSVINTDLLTNTVNGWYDASAFNSGTVQIVASAGISAGAVLFETTNDASSTAGLPLEIHEFNVIQQNTQVSAFTTAASTRRIFQFGIAARYIRVRISTAYVGGTVQALAMFSQHPFASPVVTAIQQNAGFLLGTMTPSAASGLSHTLQAAATTNATSVKASAGSIFALTASNMSAATKWLKLYNKASAPTVGTDVPVDTIPIPANSYITYEFGAVGLRFSTGIAFAITGAQADADTTALAAGDTKTHLTYI